MKICGGHTITISNQKINVNINKNNSHTNDISTDLFPVARNGFKVLNKFSKNEVHHQAEPVINFNEKNITLKNGCIMKLIIILLIVICIILIVIFGIINKSSLIPVPCLGIVVCFVLLCQFITIAPGNALVLTYYGKYIGTCKIPGYYWIRPCSTKNIISLKSNHYNGKMIKVNDKDGTPVYIGLVCVWRIKDTIKATYCVQNCYSFMVGQTESAIRYVANKFSYDSSEENEPTLKSGQEEINILLKLELQRRTEMAGIEIEDARITEISYGEEIASLMLQKQAADAIISSKKKIAKSTIQIIDDSIKELEKRKICNFNDEEKCKLVSNMMVVLNMDKGENGIIKTQKK